MYGGLAACVLLLGIFTRPVSGSRGDASSPYRSCVGKCIKELSCPDHMQSCGWSGECFGCRYDCMWKAVDIFIEKERPIPQFHELPGGIQFQEPASFIFSLLNFCGFLVFFRQIRKMRGLENARVWTMYSVIGLITWLCSAIFHARDCWVTEYLDYFSAFGFILFHTRLIVSNYLVDAFCVWICNGFVVRGSHISYDGEVYAVFGCSHVFILVIISLLVSVKINQRSFQKLFDYGYNMSVCLGVSAFTTIMYVLFIVGRWYQFNRLSPSDYMMIKIMIWTNCSVLLETLDFVPLFWTIDAHSLFHAATIPLPIYVGMYLRRHLEENEYVRLSKNV
ncbi:unnamed protein product [Nippostrongylus brasiliensis]|uniref:Post-GPI attachment to proteins factor 3 n=1 Tax=Nippostrongylus brasiliensis TaxID=27835 RepID=A0A0N4XU72_NIPBR|nr:unnamed protein product [Nippostrongylus brasiliensis]